MLRLQPQEGPWIICLEHPLRMHPPMLHLRQPTIFLVHHQQLRQPSQPKKRWMICLVAERQPRLIRLPIQEYA